jgi:hypothetical protein
VRVERLALWLVALVLVLLTLVGLIVLVTVQMLRGTRGRRLASQLRGYRLAQLVQHWLPRSHSLIHHLSKGSTGRFVRLVRVSIRRGCLWVWRALRLLLRIVALRRRSLVGRDIWSGRRHARVLRHVGW